MEINPQAVRSAEFKTVRKGVDPDEVRVFLAGVADELERAQNQSTAMEARARAAVARLQELTESGAAAAAPASLDAEEAETISRTLLLAQRTADSTLAEARAEAARVITEAKDEAAKTLDSTRALSARLVDEAREEARRVGDAERGNVAQEVEALQARREFLESDVHHLEVFLVDQRARVREAASALLDIVERVPGGLGEVHAPLLSASDDESDDGRAEESGADEPSDDGDFPIMSEVTPDDEVTDLAWGEGGSEETDQLDDAAPALDDQPQVDQEDDATEAMTVADLDDFEQSVEEPTSDFRFSFDDEPS